MTNQTKDMLITQSSDISMVKTLQYSIAHLFTSKHEYIHMEAIYGAVPFLTQIFIQHSCPVVRALML